MLPQDIPTEWAILTLANGLTFAGFVERAGASVEVRFGEPCRGTMTIAPEQVRSARRCARAEALGSDTGQLAASTLCTGIGSRPRYAGVRA